MSLSPVLQNVRKSEYQTSGNVFTSVFALSCRLIRAHPAGTFLVWNKHNFLQTKQTFKRLRGFPSAQCASEGQELDAVLTSEDLDLRAKRIEAQGTMNVLISRQSFQLLANTSQKLKRNVYTCC